MPILGVPLHPLCLNFLFPSCCAGTALGSRPRGPFSLRLQLSASTLPSRCAQGTRSVGSCAGIILPGRVGDQCAAFDPVHVVGWVVMKSVSSTARSRWTRSGRKCSTSEVSSSQACPIPPRRTGVWHPGRPHPAARRDTERKWRKKSAGTFRRHT